MESEVKMTVPKNVNTKRRPKWGNYGKAALICLVVAALIIVTIVFALTSRASADYTIGFITARALSDSGLTQLADRIAEYGVDRNGDGKIKVVFEEYIFDDSERFDASLQRFQKDAAKGGCMMYFHSDAAFEAAKGYFKGYFQYNDGTPMPDTAEDYENAMIPWTEFQALAQFVPTVQENDTWTPEDYLQVYEGLRVSIRSVEGLSVEDREKALVEHEMAVQLWEALKAGKKTGGM